MLVYILTATGGRDKWNMSVHASKEKAEEALKMRKANSRSSSSRFLFEMFDYDIEEWEMKD